MAEKPFGQHLKAAAPSFAMRQPEAGSMKSPHPLLAHRPVSTIGKPMDVVRWETSSSRPRRVGAAWDSVKRKISTHNHDQNLRSVMCNSAVWVYQRFAKEIGEERVRSALKRIDYGNAGSTTVKAAIGSTAISPSPRTGGVNAGRRDVNASQETA
jgi:hypothetical protein